jgi:hypothetical protein
MRRSSEDDYRRSPQLRAAAVRALCRCQPSVRRAVGAFGAFGPRFTRRYKEAANRLWAAWALTRQCRRALLGIDRHEQHLSIGSFGRVAPVAPDMAKRDRRAIRGPQAIGGDAPIHDQCRAVRTSKLSSGDELRVTPP